jgi:hypothetical protein
VFQQVFEVDDPFAGLRKHLAHGHVAARQLRGAGAVFLDPLLLTCDRLAQLDDLLFQLLPMAHTRLVLPAQPRDFLSRRSDLFAQLGEFVQPRGAERHFRRRRGNVRGSHARRVAVNCRLRDRAALGVGKPLRLLAQPQVKLHDVGRHVRINQVLRRQPAMPQARHRRRDALRDDII